MSYVRSVYLQKDKSIFKLDELPVDKFAESLGLPGAPKIKFLNKEQAKKQKNASRTVASLQAQIESGKAGLSSSEGESVEGSESVEDSADEARESPKPNHTTTSDDGSKPTKVCLFLCLVVVCSTRTLL